MLRCPKGLLVQRGAHLHPSVLWTCGITGGCPRQRGAAALLIPGTAAHFSKLWPRLKREKWLVNWNGKFMVQDWEPGADLQCLAFLLPFSLVAHTLLWTCLIFTLPCVQWHFGFWDIFSSSKESNFFSHQKHINFNLFQEKISQIRAPSWHFETQITVLTSSLLSVIALTGNLSEHFLKALVSL